MSKTLIETEQLNRMLKALEEYRVLLCVIQDSLEDKELDEKTIAVIVARSRIGRISK